MGTGTKQDHQVATIFDPEDYAVVAGMSEALELSRAEVVRRLVNQAIVGLRAARAAEHSGRNPETAMIDAIRAANVNAHEAFMTTMLDAIGSYLEDIDRRSWRDAT